MKRNDPSGSISRRDTMKRAAGAAALALAGAGAALADESKPQAAGAPPAINGRIKQSLVNWCYAKYWKPEELALVAKGLGCRSLELIDPKHWDMIKSHGLTCAIAGSHGFMQGMNNPKYWDRCHTILRERIDQCAAAGVPSVITFTGMAEDIPKDVGMDNCVKGYKQIIGYAEQKGVNLCLEMLNSRVNPAFVGHYGYQSAHAGPGGVIFDGVDVTMKDHPGYQGDHTDYCIELIKRVGSERMKLLFDIYHVQIMDGDVISRIYQHKEYIGHVHTAGSPGRGELDDKQEINYKPIMQALLDVGYQGYVGQEFIPTRDPLEGLKQAFAVCDV